MILTSNCSNDVKMFLSSFHRSKNMKGSKTSCHCSSWQFQTISIYFHIFLFIFYAVPHEKVRKIKSFDIYCPDFFFFFFFLDKHNLYVTCTKKEKKKKKKRNSGILSMMSYLKRGKELVKTVLVTVSGKVLF